MVPDEIPTDPTTQVGKFLGDSPLQILVSHLKEHAYVVLTGELDGATAPFLVRTLVEVNETVEGDLVLDIKKLSFIDSTGLSVLVMAHNRARADRGSIVLRNPSQSVLRILEVTGLVSVFTIEDKDAVPSAGA